MHSLPTWFHKKENPQMNNTMVAIYDDIVVARQVVEDLVKADFARSSISLITNDANNQYSHFLDKDYAPREDAVTAGEGAGFGAVVGALTGILVGVAALTIPGIGLAIAAGPIVAGLTGVVAGAVTGGVVGALVKSGVAEDEAPYYAEGIRRGGTLISVETSDTLRARDIMNRQGSVNIHERFNLWQRDGWKGFNAETVENKDKYESSVETLAAVPPSYATSAVVSPGLHEADPITIVPVVPMIQEELHDPDQNTVKSFPEMGAAPITDTSLPVIRYPIVDEPVVAMFEEESEAEYENTIK